MRKRAIWLFVLSLILPGSAQLVAGNRRFGQLALRTTLVGLASLLLFGLLFLINRGWALTLITAPILGIPLSWLIFAYGIFYVVITVDTLRLAQLGRLYPAAKRVLLALFLVVAVAGSGTYITAANTLRTADDTVATIFKQSGFTGAVDGRYNILLLGSDAGPDRISVRTDSIKVLSVNASTGATVVISIPRNLQHVPFPEDSPLHEVYPNGFRPQTEEPLINAIYKDTMDHHADLYPNAEAEGSTPGIEAMRDAAEGVTGLKIQSYVMISMEGFSQLIDALGGIDVTVLKDLPIGGERDDLSDVRGWLRAGKWHYDGYHALWYARSRHNTTDYDRMRRQTEVINATLKQANPANVFFNFEKVAGATKNVVFTDIPSGALGTYLDLAIRAKANKHAIRALDLIPEKGFEPDLPNYDKIHAAVKAQISLSN